MKTVEVDCPQCGGDGKETCDNPDHGFIAMMPGDIGRIGCPCCGHDENHKVPNGGKCEHCNGTGIVLYVLASEAEADIVSLKKQYADSCSESDSMLPEIKELRTQLTAAAERERVLMEILKEMVQAFVDYEMEVDIEPHHQHIKMMRKARAALAQKGSGDV